MRQVEVSIAFQGRMIVTLDRGGHDVKAAKMFLRQLEAKHARHVADRDLLFKRLANSFLAVMRAGAARPINYLQRWSQPAAN